MWSSASAPSPLPPPTTNAKRETDNAMVVSVNTTVQLSVHAHLHFYSRKRVTHLRRSKEWELIFPTPLSHKVTRLNSIVSVSYPTCMGTAHLTILTKAIHSYIWQSSWISPSPITSSHLTFKHFFKKNPSWKRLFLMKEFGTVSKIYFILKISGGKLEALRTSTEAPRYFSLRSRYRRETFSLQFSLCWSRRDCWDI